MKDLSTYATSNYLKHDNKPSPSIRVNFTVSFPSLPERPVTALLPAARDKMTSYFSVGSGHDRLNFMEPVDLI
ncbi:hypothetical protein GOBAR_AA34437 [Gossypium barbadense]|uniref:Uncharacterized protein n=1 Tax=Gossypium barbadense TaxID=3634 RepID=A0A2P5W570_GOSBA|nr:hypothetical protein GOBAR_AA34437 [Gossypium barbadense]